MFITSKNKYLLNDMKIFGTCSIPLIMEELTLISFLDRNHLISGLGTPVMMHSKVTDCPSRAFTSCRSSSIFGRCFVLTCRFRTDRKSCCSQSFSDSELDSAAWAPIDLSCGLGGAEKFVFETLCRELFRCGLQRK